MLYIVVVNVVTVVVVVVVVVNKVVTSPEIPQCYKKIRVLYIYFFILYSSSNQEIASAVIFT